ncbi:MAG: DUF2726 domain-containing protein [Nitrospirae bacterium]|nr:DUF2726 domain-containing protein [Nitrospirota bacterium]
MPVQASVELPPLTQIFGLVLVFVSLVLLYRLGLLWIHYQKGSSGVAPSTLPENLSAEPRCVLTKGEASLLNLVSLAVQDSYLVLAKLPVRTLVKMTAGEDISERWMVKSIQKLVADFVLIHPGTLVPEKVVFLEDHNTNPVQPDDQQKILESLFHHAQVEIIRLELDRSYTVPQLTQLFGLEEEA